MLIFINLSLKCPKLIWGLKHPAYSPAPLWRGVPPVITHSV